MSARGPTSPSAAPQRERKTILDAWDLLVDPRVGIIRTIRELPVDDDEPDFFHYLSTACDTSAFGVLKNFGNNGGVGATRRRAIAKAMGEAVERYCAAIFDESAFVYAAYDDLETAATPPETFALYRGEQYAAAGFPWKPFERDSRVAWTPGTSLVSGREVLVPAAAVYVPFHYRRGRDDVPIMQPISTGLACGSSGPGAMLSAICEAIERDAFTITWQARLSRPRIARETVPEAVDSLLHRYEAAGLRIEMVDITTDITCPTILTAAIGSVSTSPALAVAAASDPSPTTALVKSLEELAHTRKYAAQLMDHTPPVELDVAAGHPDVQTQRDHLRAYCPQHSLQYAEFLWASDEERALAVLPSPQPDDRATPGTDQSSLRTIVASLAAAGLDPIACDLTTPDVADVGLAVARVVVPGLHPLFMGHQNRALGGRRLSEVPAALGGSSLGSAGMDNPYPHPFP